MLRYTWVVCALLPRWINEPVMDLTQRQQWYYFGTTNGIAIIVGSTLFHLNLECSHSKLVVGLLCRNRCVWSTRNDLSETCCCCYFVVQCLFITLHTSARERHNTTTDSVVRFRQLTAPLYDTPTRQRGLTRLGVERHLHLHIATFVPFEVENS